MPKETRIRMFTRNGLSAVYDAESAVADWLQNDAPPSMNIRGINTTMSGQGSDMRFVLTIWYEENR